MISDRESVEDMKRIVRSNSNNNISNLEDVFLLKVDLSRLDSDGWFVRFDSGRVAWAFLDCCFGFLPDGVISNGLLMVRSGVRLRAYSEGDICFVSPFEDNLKNMNLIPNEKVIRVGSSEIRIKDKRIDINSEEVFINGVKME